MRNTKAFKNCFLIQRKRLSYKHSFDEKLRDYLVEEDRYLKYELDLLIDSEDSGNLLINFIDNISEISFLKFLRITVDLNPSA